MHEGWLGQGKAGRLSSPGVKEMHAMLRQGPAHTVPFVVPLFGQAPAAQPVTEQPLALINARLGSCRRSPAAFNYVATSQGLLGKTLPLSLGVS